jgi:hypothetical protein
MGYATGGVLISKNKFDKLSQSYQQAGAIARKNLAGKYFSIELLDQVLNHLKEFRH